MKRIYGNLATVAALVLISIPAIAIAQPSAPTEDTMTAAQARRAILESSAFMRTRFSWAPVDRNSIRFTSATFEYDTSDNLGREHHTIDLKAAEVFDIVCQKVGEACIWKHDAVKQSPKEEVLNKQNIWWIDPDYHCRQDCLQAAKNFAAALNRLHVLANDNGASWNQFQQQAAAWRALATKPPLPNAVRIQRIAAEDAIKNSRPDAAMDYYETGLAQYPTWPEGHFNAALIAAELGDYTDAVEHMQSYLELTPNAADAQSARDQIDLWQLKAKEPKPAASK